MEVRLRFDTADPPGGDVCVAGERQPFVGWLELMQVLATHVDAMSTPRSP